MTALATSAPDFVDIGTLIVQTAGVNGGKPRCALGGVSVHQLSTYYLNGETPEEVIERHFEHLTLAEVYAAYAYYLANRERIDWEVEEQARFGEELRLADASDLRARLEARRR